MCVKARQLAKTVKAKIMWEPLLENSEIRLYLNFQTLSALVLATLSTPLLTHVKAQFVVPTLQPATNHLRFVTAKSKALCLLNYTQSKSGKMYGKHNRPTTMAPVNMA